MTSVLVLAMLVFPWAARTSTPVDQWDQCNAGLAQAVAGEAGEARPPRPPRPPGHHRMARPDPSSPALDQPGLDVCSTSEK